MCAARMNLLDAKHYGRMAQMRILLRAGGSRRGFKRFERAVLQPAGT